MALATIPGYPRIGKRRELPDRRKRDEQCRLEAGAKHREVP